MKKQLQEMREQPQQMKEQLQQMNEKSPNVTVGRGGQLRQLAASVRVLHRLRVLQLPLLPCWRPQVLQLQLVVL
jgi:hypothetical protein